MQRKQDKGILVIVAYRVCQDRNSKAGAFTAYQQQCTTLYSQGQKQPNPRQQIVLDLETLIATKRQEGFRPILMMDANGDTHHPTAPDTELQEFIETTNLVDIFYKKFKESPRTFMWGVKQLEYILIDPSLIPTVESIGYLGTHEGSDTDHVYMFMDLNDRITHQGILYHPITSKLRDFMITQSDEVKTFLNSLGLSVYILIVLLPT